MPKGIRDDWATPPEFMYWIKWNFDVGLDVCANSENRKAVRWFDLKKGKDGLSEEWLHDAWNWCNPPYSKPRLWFDKAIKEAGRGCSSLVLSHCATGAQWFEKVFPFAERLILLTPRVQFTPPPGVEPSSNDRDSMLTIFTPLGLRIETSISLVNWKLKAFETNEK